MKAMKKKVIFFWIGGMKWNEIEWLTGCSFHSLNGGRSNWLYVFGPGNSNSFLLHSPFIFHMPQRLSSLQQRQLNQRRQESKWMNNEVAGLFFCGDGLWPITNNFIHQTYLRSPIKLSLSFEEFDGREEKPRKRKKNEWSPPPTLKQTNSKLNSFVGFSSHSHKRESCWAVEERRVGWFRLLFNLISSFHLSINYSFHS